MFAMTTKSRPGLTLGFFCMFWVCLSGCYTGGPPADQNVSKKQKFDLQQVLKAKKSAERHYAEVLPKALNRPLPIEEWQKILAPQKSKYGIFALTQAKIQEYLGKPERTFNADIILGAVETWAYPNYVRIEDTGKTGMLLVAFKNKLVFVVSTPDEKK
jgi:hypothetical protein